MLPQGIKWSTASVLKDSIRQARAVGLHVAPVDVLPRLQDIDVMQVW